LKSGLGLFGTPFSKNILTEVLFQPWIFALQLKKCQPKTKKIKEKCKHNNIS